MFICLHVNMALTLSVLRVQFYFYCLVARNIPSSDTASLTEPFCPLPGYETSSFRSVYKSLLGEIISVLNFVENWD